MKDFALCSAGLFIFCAFAHCILHTEGLTPATYQQAAPLLGPFAGWNAALASQHALRKRSAFSSLLNRVREQMQRSRVAPELSEAVVAADLDAAGAQMAKDTADYPDVPIVLSHRIATICYMNPVSCFGRRRIGATKYDNLDKRRY